MKTTKQQLILILSLLCISFTAIAQNFTGSLLWEISGNRLKQPSYIFGTHHLISTELLDSHPQILEKLAKSEQIVGELDMSKMDEISAQIGIASLLPEDKQYLDFISEATYNELDSLFTNLIGASLKETKFDRMKPGMLSTVCSIILFSKESKMDFTNHISLDQYLQQRAIQEEKPIVGLETVDDQLNAMFESVPYSNQVEDIICMLRNEEAMVALIKKMNEYYINADFDGFIALASDPNSPCHSSQEFSDALNKNRNDKWIKKIPSIIADKSTFIAVGCLHLMGEDGLLYQLHKQGYTVSPVK